MILGVVLEFFLCNDDFLGLEFYLSKDFTSIEFSGDSRFNFLIEFLIDSPTDSDIFFELSIIALRFQ